MVDWFGLDIVDDMSGNPHDEGANADVPHHQHNARLRCLVSLKVFWDSLCILKFVIL